MSADDREPVLAQAVAGRLMAGVPLMGGTLALTATAASRFSPAWNPENATARDS